LQPLLAPSQLLLRNPCAATATAVRGCKQGRGIALQHSLQSYLNLDKIGESDGGENVRCIVSVVGIMKFVKDKLSNS